MAEFVYQMYQARKAHGDKVILDDVTLSFYPGAKIGVVGPNGMGKSTLLKIMAGKEEVSNGEARLTPGYTVGLLEQEPPLDDDKTVIENIRMAFGDLLAKVDRFNKIGEEMCDPDCDMDALMAEMGRLQDEIDAADGWDIDSKLGQAMDALQCPDADMPVSVLSGGERRRVALCKLLLEAPDLLLLDEPTNHLDAESVLWLEHFLHNYPGAVLAVTHDRYFLDNVAEWICEVDRGHLYPYKGNYSTYLETKAARIAAQGQRDAKLAKRMAAELEWVRSSPKARQAKNKARLERYEEMEAEARASQKLDYTDIRIPVGPRLGAKVLEVEHLHKEFDGRVLIDDLTFSLPRNGIVGVIGPNGVGKSTLFKMIVGTEQPTSGSIELGETVKISYVDQMREGIDPDKSLWEVVSGGTDKMLVGETEVPSRAYVASFGFKGSDQQKRAGVLSGGERNRLNLALTLKQGGNLLLLDEPTNDLDVETLSSLEAALLEFPGCSVVISHDRMFLDRVATHILAWEGTDENPGNWYWFEGNFQSYQENRVARLGEDAAQPHRIRRKLTRD
ncbi:energy-dependent translational throttle protein EttA [Collinsella tanakaei]|uniref:Energy-dependent translational throttle protein EttA n=1 Tax=Collinsella ihumii TaxID=1720204 RepID=A0A921IS91_9ACTN|nr:MULTISPECIES: energy-dependent translational throttle protein EttA [Collinsella]MBM6689271.1 energy-dependent translational throttle protein EttA [Collinsella tanakaei]MBM6776011.1 energy-dependent translational throttle protein EttA [Collinsella tanakaei]MBM6785416.1 energy-dependent translational throttle protein EttA [Collinsella tanakaei]MCF6413304.1 energy-dependent translational throttle protein EttA [Collinsella tanakaei]MDN0056276.1 energy-dependent translational throttle protein Et